MNWKRILNEKRNETLILVPIILIIAMIGYLQSRDFSNMENTVTAIYADRLVANDYLFDLSKAVNAKQSALRNEAQFTEMRVDANNTIHQLLKSFEQTELTHDENALFLQLQKHIRLSEAFEDRMLQYVAQPSYKHNKEKLDGLYDLILTNLEGLSAIQLTEGKRLLEGTQQLKASNGMTNRLVIALFIVAVLLFMAAVSSPKVLMKRDFHRVTGSTTADS